MSNELAVRAAITPMELLQSARDANASLEQMQQLFDLQLRWEENEARKAYNQAIAEFKAEGVRIVKNKHVRFSTQKGVTDYKHATIGNVVETVTPLLSRYGLSHSWDMMQDGSNISVTCKVAHVLGHGTAVTMTAMPDDSGGKNKIQQVASTITYLQRYTLLSALGLATDDSDDDGQGYGKQKEKESAIDPIAEGDEVAYKLQNCATVAELQTAWQEIPDKLRRKYAGVKDEAKQRLSGGAK